jgi:hypothetical protein
LSARISVPWITSELEHLLVPFLDTQFALFFMRAMDEQLAELLRVTFDRLVI